MTSNGETVVPNTNKSNSIGVGSYSSSFGTSPIINPSSQILRLLEQILETEYRCELIGLPFPLPVIREPMSSPQQQSILSQITESRSKEIPYLTENSSTEKTKISTETTLDKGEQREIRGLGGANSTMLHIPVNRLLELRSLLDIRDEDPEAIEFLELYLECLKLCRQELERMDFAVEEFCNSYLDALKPVAVSNYQNNQSHSNQEKNINDELQLNDGDEEEEEEEEDEVNYSNDSKGRSPLQQIQKQQGNSSNDSNSNDTSRSPLSASKGKHTIDNPFFNSFNEESMGAKLPYEFNNKVGNKRRRGNLPKTATNLLKKWLFDHLFHPYPTEDEKSILSAQSGLSSNQISNWFINARRRILQPMLENARQRNQQKRQEADQTQQQFLLTQQRQPHFTPISQQQQAQKQMQQ